ncbi:response regulator [Pacificimonas sp. ICDLI1SI03]|tara:strand:- start:30204 stop:30560 length:357 start_codon:yes stop_codon:yes gene_type:complete
MADPRRVFVAEDNGLVMMSLEGLIEDMGWELVGPATTVPEALELAAACEVDVALLDVNLAEERSYAVAALLQERGVPILFATGYDNDLGMPESLKGAPVIMKPYALDDMEEKLRELAG